MGERWGLSGPPADAYSRVSDPEIYRPLHRLAREVADELTARYDVRREAASEPDPHRGGDAEGVRLVPADPRASPVTLVLTSFPGVVLRYGHDDQSSVPSCGCDACDETVADCEASLREQLAAVTRGTFGERLVREADGWAHERWYETDDASWSSSTPVDRSERQALAAALPRTWAPWPPRP